MTPFPTCEQWNAYQITMYCSGLMHPDEVNAFDVHLPGCEFCNDRLSIASQIIEEGQMDRDEIKECIAAYLEAEGNPILAIEKMEISGKVASRVVKFLFDSHLWESQMEQIKSSINLENKLEAMEARLQAEIEESKRPLSGPVTQRIARPSRLNSFREAVVTKLSVRTASLAIVALGLIVTISWLALKPVTEAAQKNLLDLTQIEELLKNSDVPGVLEQTSAILNNAEIKKDKYSQSRLHTLRAKAYAEEGNFTDGVKESEEALRIAQEMKNLQLQISPSILLMNIYFVNTEPAKASEYAKSVIILAQATNQDKSSIMALQIFALNQFMITREYNIAKRKLEFSRQLSHEEGFKDLEAQALTFLGLIDVDNANFDRAMNYYDQAIDIAGTLPDKSSRDYHRAIIDGYYARCSMVSGNTRKAIQLYQEALDIINALKIVQAQALWQLQEGLAEALRAQGRVIESQQYFAEAKKNETIARERCQVTNAYLSYAPNRRGIECY